MRREMIFDTQGTGFYKRAIRQMMDQPELTYLDGLAGNRQGLGDEIMLLEGIDDLGAAYPHGFDDGPARTYTMPTMDRGTLYDFSTGPVSTGMSGAKLGASMESNQGAWPRQADPRWRYTGLGGQPGWPAQSSRYMRPTMRFTGPSRAPSRVRLMVEGAKARLIRLMDESEMVNFRATAAYLAEQATGSRFWTAAVDTVAFLELASVRYPDSAWIRGNARTLLSAIESDSNARTRAALGRIAAASGPASVGPASVSGLRGASIRRGRYAYTGLQGGLGDAQSDARTAMATATFIRDSATSLCNLITNQGEKRACIAAAEVAFNAARTGIIAGYGTDGTYAPPASQPPPSAATQEQINEKLRMQAEQSGVEPPASISDEGISTNTMLIGGAVLVALLAGAYIVTRT